MTWRTSKCCVDDVANVSLTWRATFACPELEGEMADNLLEMKRTAARREDAARDESQEAVAKVKKEGAEAVAQAEAAVKNIRAKAEVDVKAGPYSLTFSCST
jgi:hypothetical protein